MEKKSDIEDRENESEEEKDEIPKKKRLLDYQIYFVK